MKKIFSVLFLLLSTVVFAQTYDYKSNGETDNEIEFISKILYEASI